MRPAVPGQIFGALGAGLVCTVIVAASGGMPSSATSASASALSGDTVRWSPTGSTHAFVDPVDAVSVGVQEDTIDLAVSAFIDGSWTEWEALELEKEFDPLLRESNLVLFPKATRLVRFAGSTREYDVKPIRISSDPVRYDVASTHGSFRPRILSRREWGADESLLFRNAGGPTTAPAETPDVGDNGNGASVPQRVRDCEEAQRNFPHEFRTVNTVSHADGKTYRWPVSYSESVHLLAVHHTAIQVTGDRRTGVERMRALYQYHAQNRGWGDVGYHYLIDENGQIYEGRNGGRYAVGGHAYCNNVGTIGIALMGNFEVERPTQRQMHSLQWLLHDLADIYRIDLSRSVRFHGKHFPSPVVAHRDLVATACPGYYVQQTLGQVRTNVLAGNFTTDIRFPVAASTAGDLQSRAAERAAERALQNPPVRAPFVPQPVAGLRFTGTPVITLAPGAQHRFSLVYTAGPVGAAVRDRIGDIERSHAGIGLWQRSGDRDLRVRSHLLLLDTRLRPGQQETIQLLVQAPRQSGTYTLTIGEVRLTLNVGRGAVAPPSTPIVTPRAPAPAPTPPPSAPPPPVPAASEPVRIRLTGLASPTLRLTRTGQSVTPVRNGSRCEMRIGTRLLSEPVIRLSESEYGFISVINGTRTRTYRGVMECRIVDGELALINELPMEEYLMGLAEEPDTEPYEKQRAFAIAARTYALHYMEGRYTKFPGKPYHGSDSPAEFQIYVGVTFENNNPRWLDAVRSTAHQVLVKDGHTIRPPYFSVSEGRTLSPAEAGWGNFPFAEIFTSKPDPWCAGMERRGHGVGMSGCGAKAQALEGRTGEEILAYYYPGTTIVRKP